MSVATAEQLLRNEQVSAVARAIGEVEARAAGPGIAVKLAVFGIALVAFVQSAGGTLLNRATEPMLMLIWGFALLAVSSGARTLLVRRDSHRSAVHLPTGAQIPHGGIEAKMVVASRS